MPATEAAHEIGRRVDATALDAPAVVRHLEARDVVDERVEMVERLLGLDRAPCACTSAAFSRLRARAHVGGDRDARLAASRRAA